MSDEKQPTIREFEEAIKRASKAIEDFVAYMPSLEDKNIPHDPSLRKDRRKWGGR